MMLLLLYKLACISLLYI